MSRNELNPLGDEWTTDTVEGQLKRLEAFWPDDCTIKQSGQVLLLKQGDVVLARFKIPSTREKP